jgi:thioester reductase-like protein
VSAAQRSLVRPVTPPLIVVLSWHRYMESSVAVSETEPLEGFEGLSVGYAQTKFVSERLILAAIDRGVPATIFRPG